MEPADDEKSLTSYSDTLLSTSMDLNLHPQFTHPSSVSSGASREGSAQETDGFSVLRKALWGISGVYSVTHRATGKKYVGASPNIFRRFRAHVSVAKRDHRNPFHRALFEFGESAFTVEVLELCSPDVLQEREQHWVTLLDSAGVNGFNVHSKVSRTRRGVGTPESAKAKLRAAHLGRTHSLEHRMHVSIAAKGRNLGRKASPETRAKMSASQQGRTDSPETKARKSAAQKGRVFSAEHKAKLSAWQQGIVRGPQSTEHVAKRVAKFKATMAARQ